VKFFADRSEVYMGGNHEALKVRNKRVLTEGRGQHEIGKS